MISLKEESGRFFFHFYEKMYRIYRKFPDSFQGDFEFLLKKWYSFEEFLHF